MSTERHPISDSLTGRVIVLGLLLSVILGAANVYVGLKAGMTVSASIPAAVVAMLIFRVLFKGGGTILGANQVQTAASAGESLAAGIIFTMPALVMVGFWKEFDFWTVTAVAFSGGLLGILFMIPMRRVFLVERKELPYPEGVACAAVLEAGSVDDARGASDARPLIAGAVVGALFKFLGGFLGLAHGTLEGALRNGGRVFYFGADISPMLVAVGLIVRLNVAVLIFIGGALAWIIGIPLLGPGEDPASAPLDQAWTLWSTKIRYAGVGAMVIGGISSIFQIRKGLMQAVVTITTQLRTRSSADERDRDIPALAILPLTAFATLLIAFLYYSFTGGVGITLLAVAAMLLMGFFFAAVASYIVGLVGNSNSPVSGMTITAVLFTGAMLHLFGFSGVQGTVAILGVAAIVCCTACTAGDVCNDLKTGQLVGASPFRQQIMQIIGVLVACLVMAPVLQLLHGTTEDGIGGRELPAPQAGLFASLARALAGDGALPWDMVGLGAGLGVSIAIIDWSLMRVGSRFRAHLMPIAVGMYLPFGLSTPILVGGLIAHLLTRDAGSDAEKDQQLHRGVLYSSGIIAGESLLGIGIACLIGLGITRLDPGLNQGFITGMTVAACLIVLYLFLSYGRSPGRG